MHGRRCSLLDAASAAVVVDWHCQHVIDLHQLCRARWCRPVRRSVVRFRQRLLLRLATATAAAQCSIGGRGGHSLVGELSSVRLVVSSCLAVWCRGGGGGGHSFKVDHRWNGQ
ncbi:unnamed protein product [Soboliphyme baturini]|uniref:Secreted protein n=1 Tax=Soboliphyme baturini TaxID=241478 RepID=A0A183IB20_9BILA|nr:unnamed protein product [Soboliphyme baturini]